MTRDLRVLIVEDSEDDAELSLLQLETEGFVVDSLRATGEKQLAAALAGSLDAVIMDYNVPGLDVRDTIEMTRRAHPDIPIIVVSGSMSAETGVELMHLGAEDYLSKADLQRLGPALRRGLDQASERSRLREVEQTYQKLFERLPVGVARSLPTGETLQINASLLRILRFPDADSFWAGTTASKVEFMAGLDRADLAAMLEQDDVVNGVELEVARHDGSRGWIRLDLCATRDAGGAITGVDAVITDIDGRKRDEAALKDAHARLGETAASLRESDAVRHGLLERLITAQEEERHRIALDIHDDAVQVMAASTIRLALMAKKVHDAELEAELGVLIDTVQAATGRLRALMFELAPPGLERHGLLVSIRGALEALSADTGIQHVLRGVLDVEPTAPTAVMVYRIVQEALANVRKHSGATSVSVVVAQSDGRTNISIMDDGVGFAASLHRAGERADHLGLASMQERIGLAGGSCKVISAAGAGTRVELSVPLADPAAVPAGVAP